MHSHLRFAQPRRSRNFAQLVFALCVSSSLIASSVFTHALASDSASVAESSNASPSPTLRFEMHTASASSVVPIRLNGRDARWQLVVSLFAPNADPVDVTEQVTYHVEPPQLASVSSDGLVTPLANGTGMITATLEGAELAKEVVEVIHFDEQQPINFPNQIVPIFTKLGCNGGGCHGKMAGQNGFKLSLLGFEPQEDYEHLVRESRGRRLVPGAPDQSLLLTKAINASPHGGGQRLELDSHEYRLLRRWIAQAMPYGTDQDPKVVSIDVVPAMRRMSQDTKQRLSILARYSDGSFENITRTAQLESNSVEMAEVSTSGLVQTHKLAGDVAIMARYQGQVTVFRASIPLGASPTEMPPVRNAIDAAVFAKLQTLGIPASSICDDSTFLRRTALDIAGRLPTIDETKKFLADASPDKRNAWIDYLLDSPDYADYFAGKWSAILRNRRAGIETQYGSYAFHDWIRQSIYSNKPYDRFVHELLTASGSIESHPPVAWLRQVSNTESRVEDVAQLFIGQRIQCARCHHHPFEKWSQNDYYQVSAFYSLVDRKEGSSPQEPHFVSRVGGAGASNPKTGQGVKPAGLDGPKLDIPQTTDPRIALADWMVDRNNPFFAKAIANRYWKHFLGKGLIEPEDDMRVTNPPSNPELLDALANIVIESNFDLKHLIRTICQSATYQMASDANESNLQDTNCFSRYYPKRLQAEVLLDSLDTVCGTVTPFDGMPIGTRAISLPDTSFQSYFLTVFGRPESSTACECERTQESNLAQSLHLLNSKEILAKLSSEQGRAAQWGKEPAIDLQKRIEELYLIAFSRLPNAREIEVSLNYLEKKKANQREALEDLVWAVVNSKEFLFNH